jgi:hypothetical protein
MLVTLATLLLGLAVVFWAPAAKAHCPHGNSTTHEHCPGEPPPPPPEATLGDLACDGGEIAKYDGAAWICAADEDTDTNTDTLGGLVCSEGEVAKTVSGVWACAADSDTLADLPSCIDGDVAKFDGTDWYCASSALSPPVVVDSTDAVVGNVVGALAFGTSTATISFISLLPAHSTLAHSMPPAPTIRRMTALWSSAR